MLSSAVAALPSDGITPPQGGHDFLPLAIADALPDGVAGLLVAILVLVVAVKLVARLARTAAKVAVVLVAVALLTGGGAAGIFTGLF